MPPLSGLGDNLQAAEPCVKKSHLSSCNVPQLGTRSRERITICRMCARLFVQFDTHLAHVYGWICVCTGGNHRVGSCRRKKVYESYRCKQGNAGKRLNCIYFALNRKISPLPLNTPCALSLLAQTAGLPARCCEPEWLGAESEAALVG